MKRTTKSISTYLSAQSSVYGTIQLLLNGPANRLQPASHQLDISSRTKDNYAQTWERHTRTLCEAHAMAARTVISCRVFCVQSLHGIPTFDTNWHCDVFCCIFVPGELSTSWDCWGWGCDLSVRAQDPNVPISTSWTLLTTIPRIDSVRLGDRVGQ